MDCFEPSDSAVCRYDWDPRSFGSSDDSGVARMQKKRILKQYGLLKEELGWPDIISIASKLNKDGKLTRYKLNQICDKSQPRRKAADMLLTVVLGKLSSVSAFMRILNSESHLTYIRERINRTQLPAKEMKSLDNPPAKKLKRINHNQKISASDAVEKIFSDLKTATVKQKLRSQVSKDLNLKFKEAFKEFSGIMLTFKVEK